MTVIRIPTGKRKGDEGRGGEETEKEVRGDGKAKGRKGGREKWKRVGRIGKERGKGRERSGR